MTKICHSGNEAINCKHDNIKNTKVWKGIDYPCRKTMQYPAISLLPQRPSEVKLDAIKVVARKKCQAQGKGSFIMWLGNLLTMVVQEYHRAFSRKVVLRLEYCTVEEFLEI